MLEKWVNKISGQAPSKDIVDRQPKYVDPTRMDALGERRSSVWHSADVSPTADGFYAVVSFDRKNPVVRRTLYAAGRWVDSEPVAKWRFIDSPKATRPVTELADSKVTRRPVKAEELDLIPKDGASGLSDERRSLLAISKAAMQVEIVCVYAVNPASRTNGMVSGQVLAKGEREIAQRVGSDIVLHRIEDLSREVEPGEKVTLDYVGGRAEVYDGLLYDVVIHGPTPAHIKAEFRRHLLDAVAQCANVARKPELVRAAVEFASARTCEALKVGSAAVAVGEVTVVEQIHRGFTPFTPAVEPMEPIATQPGRSRMRAA